MALAVPSSAYMKYTKGGGNITGLFVRGNPPSIMNYYSNKPPQFSMKEVSDRVCFYRASPSAFIIWKILPLVNLMYVHGSRQTPRKSAALKPKFWCRLKWKLRFSVFWKFPSKIVEFILFKAKICSQTKNYRIMNYYQYFWARFPMIFRVYVKIFSHTFFHFMKEETFFDYFVKIRA